MRISTRLSLVTSCLLAMTVVSAWNVDAAEAEGRWPEQKANDWYQKTGWLVGANYTPAYAINQLEMWQADTFDVTAIDRELKWAEDLGFNSIRVYLHHLLWEQDKEGFLKRMDEFLDVCQKHKIGVMFVLFDSCWDPEPMLGKQRPPQKGVHNSGWVQSPGKKDLLDESRHPLLEAYVTGVVGRFKADIRIHAWDIWNEPDNQNDNSYGKNKLKTEPAGKVEATLKLLPKAFAWARAAGASQPLTSAPWIMPKDPEWTLSPTDQVQVDHSDIITIHTYNPLPGAKRWVEKYKQFKRPIIVTEYMARPNGSRFDPNLGYFKEQNVGAYCWGFVAGKSNTIFAWKTWQEPESKPEPEVWFHDIFRPDGTPFDPKEVAYIKSVTGK